MSRVAAPTLGGFLLTTLLLVGVLSLLGILSQRNDVLLDVSAGKRRTLAPETLEILSLLDSPVIALGFYASSPGEEDRMRELLERYASHTSQLRFRFVDLDRRPELAQLYDVTQNRTVVLSSGENRIRLVDPSEPDLTGALVRLLRDVRPRILFVTGHGEASVDDTSGGGLARLGEELRRQNLDVQNWLLPAASGVPEAEVVVLASPEAGLTPAETELLTGFVLRGGRLMVLVEPGGSVQADSLLARFGVLARADFIVDGSAEQRNVSGVDDSRIVLGFPAAPEHPALRGFNAPTLYPLARSLASVQPLPTGVRLERLVETSPVAWGESDFGTMVEGQPSFAEDSDTPGPLALAYAVEVELKNFHLEPDTSGFRDLARQVIPSAFDARDRAAVDTLEVGGRRFVGAVPEQARLVVLGDVDFVNNANLLVRGNRELFLSMLLWLADPDARIALAPWGIDADLVVLTRSQIRWIRLVGMLILPVVPFVFGAGVLWRRRGWV